MRGWQHGHTRHTRRRKKTLGASRTDPGPSRADPGADPGADPNLRGHLTWSFNVVIVKGRVLILRAAWYYVVVATPTTLVQGAILKGLNDRVK